MSNSKMLEKNKWVVKVVVLDAKDAKVSDLSQIKCMHDSSESSIITTEKVRFLQI